VGGLGAEQDLTTEKRRYRSLVEATTSVVWTADPRGGIVEPQPSWEGYTGQTWDEYQGLGWGLAVHPEDRERVVLDWQQAAARTEVFETEGRLWHAASGAHRWCVSRGAPIIDDEGRIVEWVGTVTDIHDAVVAREEVAAASNRLLVAETVARRAAEEAADRADRLGRVAVAVSGALTADSLADALVEELLPALGADTFVLSILDQGRLRMVRTVGMAPEVEARLGGMLATPDNPVSEAVRGGEAIFLSSAAEHSARYPHLDDWRGVMANEAWVHLPLAVQGRVLGGLQVGFRQARRFSEADRVFLETVASVAGQALHQAQLLEAEQNARRDAEGAARRLRQLQDISDVALARLSLDELVAALRVRLRGVLAVDTVRIMLLAEDRVHLRPAALAPDDPAGPDFQVLIGRGVAGRIAAGRSPLVLPDASTVERLDPILADVASVAGVPLLVRDRLVGVIHVGTRAPRRFTLADVELLELAAERIAVAIDRSQAFEAQREMARTLQAALLPPSLPAIPGVSLSARYIAAGEGTDVGGDFYDVFGLGGGAWLVIVGDVCGRGPEAAGMTGLARHTVRAVAPENSSPAEILRRLNTTLGAEGADERFATAVCARFEPRPGGMRFVLASGGHCPPMVVRRDGRTEIVDVRGTLLGPFPDIELEERVVELAAGESLVLYTDGVVEAQGESGLFGESRLAELLSSSAGRTSAELAAVVESAVWMHAGGAHEDDLAVVVVQVPAASAPTGKDHVLADVRLPVGELSARVARRVVAAGLVGHLAPEDIDAARLAVSELVTNAYRYGRRTGEGPGLRVLAGDGRVRLEVRNRGRGFDFPSRPHDLLAESGRGLDVVRTVADSAGVDEEDGTVSVWCTFSVRAPATFPGGDALSLRGRSEP
jgi:PAS domain S-box-containing protein